MKQSTESEGAISCQRVAQQCAGLRCFRLVDGRRKKNATHEPITMGILGALRRLGSRLPSSFLSQAECCPLLLLRPPPSFLLVRPLHFPRRRWGYSFNTVLFRLQLIQSLVPRIFHPFTDKL